MGTFAEEKGLGNLSKSGKVGDYQARLAQALRRDDGGESIDGDG